jgi:non-specific serine/threonine protein kinase
VRWTPDAPDAHLVVTTYGTLVRDKALAARTWRLCVLDEAQAIKNPGTRQTRAVKAIRADARIALTGTPVENRLGDLWSLMDFLNPGLLGTAAAFGRALKRWAVESDGHAPLRRLVSPYLLRRKKTDRSVISDLPDKVEMVVSCGLSRRQAALYQEAVDTLARELGEVDGDTGVRRRGVVLAALMRMKQICNHPSQWLGDGAWAPTESGKLLRLAELAAEIASRQEKLLVFTQFRQVTQPLQSLLGGVFGREGLVLHGETTARGRTALVERFQGDPEVPYMVLSLKAGGTGLNLTAASHVVHFDRWWNPAVEDQATDRAFRIGQVKNVMVHKFVCRGTVEERIDALIQAKRALAGSVVDVAGDVSLTEMSDAALLAAVSLDLGAALEDDGGDAT